MLELSCNDYSRFLVSSTAIVNTISGIRILKGSMINSRGSWMSIPRGSISRTTITMITARRPLITIRIPPIRYAHLGAFVGFIPFPIY